jgi:phosphatidylinositol 3-kinase
LLSISDRNTENLMLTQRGDLFHIDFGYSVDGNDPKILKTSCIRITTQMLDALGGTESKEYEEFKEMCGNVYDILRRHVSTFVCLLSLLPTYKSTSKTSPMVDEKAMISEIVKRFCPGESYDEAIRNLKTRIDNSTDSSTLSKYHIIDFFHKHNRESTVSNLIGDTFNFAYKGTKNIVGGLYSYWYQ